MVSENVKRDWIEVGVHSALSSAYWVVAKILAVNILIGAALIFFPSLAAVTMVLIGITVGMLIFMIATACTVKADKISRKEA